MSDDQNNAGKHQGMPADADRWPSDPTLAFDATSEPTRRLPEVEPTELIPPVEPTVQVPAAEPTEALPAATAPKDDDTAWPAASSPAKADDPAWPAAPSSSKSDDPAWPAPPPGVERTGSTAASALPGTPSPAAGDPFAAPAAGAQPAQPAAPWGAQPNPYGQPTPTPYAQQPHGQSYAQPGPYQSPGYPQPGTYPAPGYGAPRVPAQSNASALALTIVSAVAAMFTCFIIGLPSVILGAIGLSSNVTDPAGARKKATLGWWLLLANVLLVIAAVIGLVVLAEASSPANSVDSPYPTSPTTTRDIGF